MKSNVGSLTGSKISVIVPVYNSESTIQKCVQSLLTQRENIEIILVDDGSEDLSGKICDDYSNTISFIKVIHKKNGGVSSARNAGMDVATGQYIMFCDSDDYVEPEWSSNLLAVIKQNPDAFVSCDIIREKADGRGDQALRETKKECVIGLSYFELYKRGISAYTWNKIYLREKIPKNRLRFDETRSFAEDVFFNVEYCSLCSSCLFLRDYLYHYVITEGSLMNKYYSNYFGMHLPIFTCRLPLIQKEEVAEYCDIWLYHFLQMFKNIFFSNEMTFVQKMKYNQRMVKSSEFQMCLNLATGKKENPTVIKFLKHKNYYAFWLLQNVSLLKRKILRRT